MRPPSEEAVNPSAMICRMMSRAANSFSIDGYHSISEMRGSLNEARADQLAFR